MPVCMNMYVRVERYREKGRGVAEDGWRILKKEILVQYISINKCAEPTEN